MIRVSSSDDKSKMRIYFYLRKNNFNSNALLRITLVDGEK